MTCVYCGQSIAVRHQEDSGYTVDVYYHIDQSGKSLGVYCADGKHYVQKAPDIKAQV